LGIPFYLSSTPSQPIQRSSSFSKPVIIKALDPQSPFGTFGIVGRNASPKTIINGLHPSGGSEKFINGIYFSGALSIHHMDVELTNSLIESNHADDGLNIKYGNILIDNSVFKNREDFYREKKIQGKWLSKPDRLNSL